MEEFNKDLLKQLYIPPPNSHKGQNGKLLIIGGSQLFHAASLWSLKVASRIVDMVYYSSVPENNQIVQKAKEEFRDGIVVCRDQIEDYIKEADCVLIGPGMVREDDYFIMTEVSAVSSLEDVTKLADSEGEETYFLTGYLLNKYPHKKWVIDGGALQMTDPRWLLQLKTTPILTPHKKEFERLLSNMTRYENINSNKSFIDHKKPLNTEVEPMSKKFNSTVLLKGRIDIVCSPEKCMKVKGGNAGMTKGGTGDVLAGLVAALYCKNDGFLSAACGSYINKKAGDRLFEKVGYYFNSSDLTDEIPKVMKEVLL
ncbi:MAG: NAD(P)H-hydrate dehydratase [Candidatus Levybacteria bacterium RIFCSPHIGHO2_01_FULL_36_15]|nr:MAG: NAD(P)H-hydrate dehydratase [Candidatus Levybacteria bacterium RIFCSPHIGHO2_01_FULL_36_15]OGH38249.1 MAG: NAD(P)H-hydrate dehydratase [Candidatus Levybacteria bacterium RIFCSPLOWO2_01_FULL_36_10]